MKPAEGQKATEAITRLIDEAVEEKRIIEIDFDYPPVRDGEAEAIADDGYVRYKQGDTMKITIKIGCRGSMPKELQ